MINNSRWRTQDRAGPTQYSRTTIQGSKKATPHHSFQLCLLRGPVSQPASQWSSRDARWCWGSIISININSFSRIYSLELQWDPPLPTSSSLTFYLVFTGRTARYSAKSPSEPLKSPSISPFWADIYVVRRHWSWRCWQERQRWELLSCLQLRPTNQVAGGEDSYWSESWVWGVACPRLLSTTRHLILSQLMTGSQQWERQGCALCRPCQQYQQYHNINTPLHHITSININMLLPHTDCWVWCRQWPPWQRGWSLPGPATPTSA